ncbi:hypothetical protein CORC01_00927 [Colletotrichum orchidophilum]|uniref:DUF7770 domain-containing protein n=1 Tax=Colletotrichum orchidophilum TaxID=1209926 RepID=A0A1G4BQK6_9PEZI|nr:uncharacterized protein CORC01_00927 [Colletotrichum orchidophilum]OHF03608.1 hypothetical protein CORC01_00927 [Colletotrichum orchidophilum]
MPTPPNNSPTASKDSSFSSQKGFSLPVSVTKPIVYVPKGKEEAILSTPISGAKVIAHNVLEGGANHWCFYLTVAPDVGQHGDMETLIQVDCAPSGLAGAMLRNGSQATIVVSHVEREMPNDAQHAATMAVSTGCRVGSFIRAIEENGRDKYDFDENGRGCRQWTSDQNDLFLQLGLLSSAEQAEQAKSDILLEWEGFEPTGRRFPLDCGVYYE